MEFSIGFFKYCSFLLLISLTSSFAKANHRVETYLGNMPPVSDCHDVLLGIEKRFLGYDGWRMVKVRTVGQNNNIKHRVYTMSHKNRGVTRYIRSQLLEPDEVKGMESFSIDYFDDGKQDKTWLYMPSVNKVLSFESKDLKRGGFTVQICPSVK